MNKIVVVASGTRGAGKTTSVAALGAILADARHDVLLVDCDFAAPSLADSLGIEAPDATVQDVIAGRVTPQDAIETGPSGVSVMSGENATVPSSAALASFIDGFDSFDIVICDTGHPFGDAASGVRSVADGVIVVSTPDDAARRNTAILHERLQQGESAPLLATVLTRVSDASVTSEWDCEVLASIPESDAVASGRSNVVDSPGDPAVVAYRTLAGTVTERLQAEPVSSSADQRLWLSPHSDLSLTPNSPTFATEDVSEEVPFTAEPDAQADLPVADDVGQPASSSSVGDADNEQENSRVTEEGNETDEKKGGFAITRRGALAAITAAIGGVSAGFVATDNTPEIEGFGYGGKPIPLNDSGTANTTNNTTTLGPVPTDRSNRTEVTNESEVDDTESNQSGNETDSDSTGTPTPPEDDGNVTNTNADPASEDSSKPENENEEDSGSGSSGGGGGSDSIGGNGGGGGSGGNSGSGGSGSSSDGSGGSGGGGGSGGSGGNGGSGRNVDSGGSGGDGSDDDSAETVFAVSDLTPQSVTLPAGEQFTVSVTVTNTGDATGSQTIDLRCSGEVRANRSVTLDAGEAATKQFSGIDTTGLEPGTHEYGVYATDSNQTGSLTVESPAPGEAVFEVTDLTPQNVTFPAGEPFTASATVANTGDAAGDQMVELRIGENVHASRSIALDAGEQVTAEFSGLDTTDVDPATYEYGIYTAASNQTGSLTVESPDPGEAVFEVTGLSPDSVTLPAGEAFTASATVTNTGDAAGEQTVEIRIEDNVRADRSVALDAGESVTAEFSELDTTGLKPATYEYGIYTADSNQTGSLTVESPDPGEAVFEVANLSPDSVTLPAGELFTVSATVTNTGDAAGDQIIELRFGGQVRADRSVALDAGESVTAEFSNLDTTGLEPATYEYGIYTAASNQTGSLTVESSDSGDGNEEFGTVGYGEGGYGGVA